MKRVLITLVFGFLVAILAVFPRQVKGWFGAGNPVPGGNWPPTITGLRGQIALPEYKFAPDFYTVGDNVVIHVQGTNLTSEEVTSRYFLAISKVNQSPTGSDINDGTPSTPGLNENTLFINHNAGNDAQTLISTIDLGTQTFPANGSTTFSGSYLTTQAGYFQFDFMDINPSGDYQPGHILAAGFFRVLSANSVSSPTPTPIPTQTPTPTPQVLGMNTVSNGPPGPSQCGAQKPPKPGTLTAEKTSPTTVKLTWSAVTPVTYYAISYGTDPNNFQFGVPNVGNSTSFVVGALNPNLKYYFKVIAVNDCMPSDPTAEVSPGGVLGASTEKVLGASTDRLAATDSDLYLPRIMAAAMFFVLSLTSGVKFLHGSKKS